MLKLKVYQITKFLETVNACQGAVYLINANGTKTDIHSSYAAQSELLQRYGQAGGFVKLAIHIPMSSDYMRMVNFMIEDH